MACHHRSTTKSLGAPVSRLSLPINQLLRGDSCFGFEGRRRAMAWLGLQSRALAELLAPVEARQ